MPPDIAPAGGLMPAERHAFETDGFFKLVRAFDPTDAARMEDEWWDELADKWGVTRSDPSTWRQLVTHMKRPKRSRSERLFETGRMKRSIDAVLGEGAWDWPKHWGRAKLNMPSGQPATAWDLPKRLWHWDGELGSNIERPQAVFVFAFVGEVAPAGGGTLVLAGSQKLVRRQYLGLTNLQRANGATWQRDQFGRLSPWLKALTGHGPGPDDRIGAFMSEGGEADGVAMRVVELTGAPGDAYVCDPLLVHCVAPNCGERPRMMRIQMVYNRETRQVIERARDRSRSKRLGRNAPSDPAGDRSRKSRAAGGTGLPARPDLVRLRREARALQRACLAGDAGAMRQVTKALPDADPRTLPLAKAQAVVARSYGWASWPALRREVEARRAAELQVAQPQVAQPQVAQPQFAQPQVVQVASPRSGAAPVLAALAALWFALAESGDLSALNRALAVGKRQAEGARAIMHADMDRYRAFQQSLARGLQSSSPRTRFECAHALDMFGDASTRAPLVPLMDDSVPRVRWMAMHALSCHACSEKPELEAQVLDRILTAIRSDPSSHVRRHAAVALAGAHAVAAVPALREMMDRETDRKVLRTLAWVLGELARPAQADAAGV